MGWKHRGAEASTGALLLYAMTVASVAGQPASDDLVQRGNYLAQAGDCISCHTAPGGAPFAGGLKIATPFGYLVSPNITPDSATGIGTWSADDLYRALHDGINKKGQYLYPAMPYVFFTKVTRPDVDAIHAYLRTVKPVTHSVDVNHLDFPYSVRTVMFAWQELWFTPGTYVNDASQSEQWNRGAYLVEGLGHCSACHSPRNFMGAVEQRERFTGAEIGSWFAPNLTENLRTGLGNWSTETLAGFLKHGYAVNRTQVDTFSPDPMGYARTYDQTASPSAVGPMAEVWHNSTRHLTDADTLAMAVYLKSLPAETSPLAEGQPTPQPYHGALGAHLFIENCSGCHMPNGRGAPGVNGAPPLAGNPLVVAPSPDSVLSMLLGGQPSWHGFGGMPAFKAEFTDAEIAALVSYLRTHWGNDAPQITPQQVATFRQQFFPGKLPQ